MGPFVLGLYVTQCFAAVLLKFHWFPAPANREAGERTEQAAGLSASTARTQCNARRREGGFPLQELTGFSPL